MSRAECSCAAIARRTEGIVKSFRRSNNSYEKQAVDAGVIVAILFAALFEAGYSVFRLPARIPVSVSIPTILIGVLFTMSLLCAVSMALLFIARQLVTDEKSLRALAFPSDRLMQVWCGRKEDGYRRFSEIVRGASGYLALFAFVFGVSVLALKTFREPFRISVLIAALTALFAFPLVKGTPFLLVRAPLINRLFSFQSVRAGRFVLILIGAIVLLGIVLALVHKDDIFGAWNPYPVGIGILFCCLLFGVQPFLAIRTVFLFHRIPLSVLFTGAFTGAVVSAALLPSSRDLVGKTGALGAVSYGWVCRALDMDDDGFAWIVGSDCHPFDPKSNPFAPEIPGNGYDEDCDGRDTENLLGKYTDPLDELKPVPKELRRPRGNVLLIISDATAASHLEAYGYSRKTMPAVKNFAKSAALFENYFAVGNHTSIAMPALLTGRYPSTFSKAPTAGWHSFGLKQEDGLIQVRLKRAGYETFMFAGHTMSGFVRYFDHLEQGGERSIKAAPLGASALAQLKRIGPKPKKPVFFFIHFFDPHHPYLPTAGQNKFGTKAIDLYDGELADVDHALRPILKLMNSNAYKDWLVLFTADHGEGFNEHGELHHGNSLFDEEVRVPFIARVPGFSPSDVRTAASHLDLLPTVLDWCGIKADKKLKGRSLLPLLYRQQDLKAAFHRVVFSEFFRTGNEFAAFDGRYTMIYKQYQDALELYDRKTDPEQLGNCYEQGKIPAMEMLLKKFIRDSQKRIAAHKLKESK
jgi:arylsulfatase A-like enzyme